jgi:hypothetical protein
VSREALERKHESQDPPLRGILLVAGMVALTVMVSLGVIWALMHSLSATRPMPSTESLGILTAPNLAPLERFPTPNLQLFPRADLLALTAREDGEMTNYGWLNRTAGVVRIPIARAMELISQRGLPTADTNAIRPDGKSSLELIENRSLRR